MTTKRSQGSSCKDGVQTGSETLVQCSVAAVALTFFLEKVAASPAPSVPLPKELPRLGYFILCCPIQPSFQRPQPCQCRACTKGLFDFLFVFICQQRGRGQERKSFWVLKFLFGLFHSRSWLPGTNSCLSWGLGGWAEGARSHGRRCTVQNVHPAGQG